mmetsp:Transcript_10289/g.13511  ORF Transcript_10289/g.13511 Transcript_10289/m.13511 type:complete len:494 (+) Transcript_10289:148-1629(+)
MNKEIRCHIVPGCKAIVDFFHWRENGKVAVENYREDELPLASTKDSLEGVSKSAPYDFFLTHFHGDHYSGLTEKWTHLIYCTPSTAKLASTLLGVDSKFFVELSLDTAYTMPTGYKVTPVDANHCPGAAMLLFETKKGKKYLHCGDCRYTPSMKDNKCLQQAANSLESIYLDTTYAHPKHAFPKQKESIKRVIEKAKAFLKTSISKEIKPGRERVLILMAAYNIGKERMIRDVATALGVKVYVSERKSRIIECLDLEWKDTLHELVTSNPATATVHVCKMDLVGQVWPFFQPNFVGINRYRERIEKEHGIKYQKILAILPTGWADSSNWNKKNSLRTNKAEDIQTFLVPYSEHSNFNELRELVKFLRPGRVIPTVYSDEKDSKRIASRFNDLINRRNSKRQFLRLFSSENRTERRKLPERDRLNACAVVVDEKIEKEVAVIDILDEQDGDENYNNRQSKTKRFKVETSASRTAKSQFGQSKLSMFFQGNEAGN